MAVDKTHRRDASSNSAPPLPEVGLLSAAFGALCTVFGAALLTLTLAGAISGYAAVGFFDIALGAMFIAFSGQSMKFGYQVMIGRQTAGGVLIDGPRR